MFEHRVGCESNRGTGETREEKNHQPLSPIIFKRTEWRNQCDSDLKNLQRWQLFPQTSLCLISQPSSLVGTRWGPILSDQLSQWTKAKAGVMKTNASELAFSQTVQLWLETQQDTHSNGGEVEYTDISILNTGTQTEESHIVFMYPNSEVPCCFSNLVQWCSSLKLGKFSLRPHITVKCS